MPTLDIPSNHKLLAWTPERWAIVRVPDEETPHYVQFNLMRAQRRGFVCLPRHLTINWEWWGSCPINQQKVLELIRYDMEASSKGQADRVFRTAKKAKSAASWVQDLTPPDVESALKKVADEKLSPSSMPLERYGVRPLPDYTLVAHFTWSSVASSKSGRAFELWAPPGTKKAGMYKLCCVPGTTSRYANNWIRWSPDDKAIIDVIPEYCSIDVTEANAKLMRAVATRLSRTRKVTSKP